MAVENISFSAHADAKGIINLLRNIDPDEIVFVHGDKMKMEAFQPMVEQQLQKRVHMPKNLVSLSIPAQKRTSIVLK